MSLGSKCLESKAVRYISVSGFDGIFTAAIASPHKIVMAERSLKRKKGKLADAAAPKSKEKIVANFFCTRSW